MFDFRSTIILAQAGIGNVSVNIVANSVIAFSGLDSVNAGMTEESISIWEWTVYLTPQEPRRGD